MIMRDEATLTQINKGLAEKDKGGEAFKAGEYQQAIKHYATANLFLRGVSPNLAKMHQVNFPTPMPKAKPPSDKERFTAIPDDESEASEATSTEEKSGAEDEGKNDEGYGDAAAKEAQSAQTAQPGVDEKYTAQEVRKQQIACLVNSSICYSKLEKWDRCKARAQEAVNMDPENFKARFRVAQATCRLGEITKGRQLLEKLKEKSDDVSIRNELKVLIAAEKKREEKSASGMRGFFNKDKGQSTEPKIQEIVDAPSPNADKKA